MAIKLSQLKRLAGGRSFARGEAYFNDGRVSGLAERSGTVSAIVEGQSDYRVTLSRGKDGVEYSCDCPVGREGTFCKHLVAVGLAWIESPDAGSGLNGKGKRQSQEAVLLSYLERQDKSSLIRLLVEAAGEHRDLGERLMLAAVKDAPEGLDLAAFRRAITAATRTGGYVDYRRAGDYARHVHQTVTSIGALLDDTPEAVIELTEFMLKKVARAIGEMDDSDGYMGQILSDLQELHLNACLPARPGPVALARRLFEWESTGDWDIFNGAVETYAEVFGAAGVAEYRRLAEAAWAKLPPRVASPSSQYEHDSSRSNITAIMEALARQSGDVDALVEIKRRDLSNSYQYLKIAEIYQKARRRDEALACAEDGLKRFPRRDPRLVEFVALQYHRRGRHDEAMELIWREFFEQPSLTKYQDLQKNAQAIRPTPAWDSWREKALAHLREKITLDKQKQDSRRAGSRPVYWDWQIWHSPLVEIFLWEQRFEDAWQEAISGDCPPNLWMRLLAEREKEHPADAIPIYQELVEPLVNQTNNRAYAEAADLARKIRTLRLRLDDEPGDLNYIESLRLKFKAKRNFIKLLDAIEKK